MYGSAMGILSTDLIIGDSIVKNVIPRVTGNQGNQWIKATINLAPYMGNTVVIRINGKTGNNFESDIAIDNFSVYDPTVTAPSANFSVSDSAGCTTTQFTFSDLSSGGASTYTWDFGAGATPATASGAGPHTVTYASAGVKRTSLEVSNVGGINQKFFNVSVGQTPVTNYNHTVILNTAYFIDQSVNAPLSWSWDFGDGNTSNLSSPQNTYTNAGKYEVTLTTTNDCGSNTYKDSVEITTSIGLSEALLSAIALYPNPTSAEFKVELPSQISGGVEVVIASLSGKTIREFSAHSANSESLRFDISDLPDGVYLVTIKTSEGSKNIRVVKKR
jgi:PKD repeat protein